MIAPSSRMTTPLARQAMRQSVKAASPTSLLSRATQRRMASTTESAVDQTKAAYEKTKSAVGVKSDAPWAIGSVVVFGGMFIYLTAPPKGGKKGHGHEASHDDSSSDSDDSGADTDATQLDDDNRDYDNVKKIEDNPGKTGPKGGQHLAERSLSPDEGAMKQKKTKTADDIGKPDDITFKKGVEASKEGHKGGENSHISDPKKVVASAHAQRDSNKQDSKNASQESTENKDSREVDELNDSPESADANAQNDAHDEDRQASEDVHNSENAKKANAINEEEGSDKAD